MILNRPLQSQLQRPAGADIMASSGAASSALPKREKHRSSHGSEPAKRESEKAD